MNLGPTQIPLPPSPALTITTFQYNPGYCSDNKDLVSTTALTINIFTPETASNNIGNSIKILEHHNYHQWKDMMQSYFLVDNLDGIVNGSEPQPTSHPPEINSWMQDSFPWNSTLAIVTSS